MSTPWNPAYQRTSKTHTSAKVKDRYNRRVYDQITFRAGKGTLEVVRSMAEARGLSMAAYLRYLIQQDCKAAGKPEFSATVGGGGDFNELGRMMDMTAAELYKLITDETDSDAGSNAGTGRGRRA